MAVNPMMEGVMSTGVQGLNSALKGLNEAAQDVAELNVARNAGWGNSSRKARDRE